MDEYIIPFVKEHALALGLGAAGVICLGMVCLVYQHNKGR